MKYSRLKIVFYPNSAEIYIAAVDQLHCTGITNLNHAQSWSDLVKIFSPFYHYAFNKCVKNYLKLKAAVCK